MTCDDCRTNLRLLRTPARDQFDARLETLAHLEACPLCSERNRLDWRAELAREMPRAYKKMGVRL